MGREVIKAFMDVTKIVIQADVAFVFAAMISSKVGTLSQESFRIMGIYAIGIFLALSATYILLAEEIEKLEAR